MPYMVTMLNEGGTLDRTVVNSGTEAARAAIVMIKMAGELRHGDSFVIVEIDDGQAAIFEARGNINSAA